MRGTGRVKNMIGLKSEKMKNIEFQQNWWCSDKKVCIAICSSEHDNKRLCWMRNKHQSSCLSISTVLFPVWDSFWRQALNVDLPSNFQKNVLLSNQKIEVIKLKVN